MSFTLGRPHSDKRQHPNQQEDNESVLCAGFYDPVNHYLVLNQSLVVRVLGNQVHPVRRLARLISSVRGIHCVVPIQNLSLARL